MIIEGMLCAIIAIMSVMHYIERQKLQDRIMSRNLTEYKKIDEPHVKHKSAHDRVMERWKEIK